MSGNDFAHIRWEAIQPRSCADCSFVGNSFRDVLKPIKGAGRAFYVQAGRQVTAWKDRRERVK